jgi:hypothetical protein
MTAVSPEGEPVPAWPDGQPVTPWADPWHDIAEDIASLRLLESFTVPLPPSERKCREQMYRESGHLTREMIARLLAGESRYPAGVTPEPQPPHPKLLSEVISIRFSSSLVAAAKQAASAEGMDVGAWIRREVQREADRRDRQCHACGQELPEV